MIISYFRWWRAYVPKNVSEDLSHSDTRWTFLLQSFCHINWISFFYAVPTAFSKINQSKKTKRRRQLFCFILFSSGDIFYCEITVQLYRVEMKCICTTGRDLTVPVIYCIGNLYNCSVLCRTWTKDLSCSCFSVD